MKKFIALAALVLTSMVTTTVYAQESNAQRRADRKAQRDAELEEKLAACRRAQEACGSDYVRLQELTDEQERLSAELDEKTERWVYLNDLKEKIDAQNSQG